MIARDPPEETIVEAPDHLFLDKAHLGDGSFNRGWFMDPRGIVLVDWITPLAVVSNRSVTLKAVRAGCLITRNYRGTFQRSAIAPLARRFLADLEPETEHGPS